MGQKGRGTEIPVSKIPGEFAMMTEADLADRAEAATAILLQPVHSGSLDVSSFLDVSSLPTKQSQPHRAHLRPCLGPPDEAA